jgi:hypothetical protein
MRIIYLILTVFAVSCASFPHKQEKPEVVVPKQVETPPNICDTLVTAINRGDWATLRTWAKPGTSADDSVAGWEKAAATNHAVRVGKFLNVQTVGETGKKPYKLYSYSLENKDGTVNPHWLQIKVREANGVAEVLDFWNFGW